MYEVMFTSQVGNEDCFFIPKEKSYFAKVDIKRKAEFVENQGDIEVYSYEDVIINSKHPLMSKEHGPWCLKFSSISENSLERVLKEFNLNKNRSRK